SLLRLDAMHSGRHAKGLTQDPVQSRPAGSGYSGTFPGTSKLGGDLLLAGLGGIQAAGEKKQMLDGGLARPGAQNTVGLAGLRVAPDQGPEDRRPGIPGWNPLERGVQHLDAIAGADIEHLGDTQAVPQRGQARRDLPLRDRETRDLIDIGMTVGQTHHADLVHGPSTPRGVSPSVTERSPRPDLGLGSAAPGLIGGP